MTREQAINYLISRGLTQDQVGDVVRALTYIPRDCANCKHYVVKDTRTNWESQETTKIYGCECWECEYEPTTKNNLGVEEVTALAEWTEKLTKASEDAYNKGYADGMKAQAEPKTGHWIEKGKTDIAYDMCGYKSWATKYMCNHCGFIHTAIENHGVYSYCPNCGAKMESEVEDGDED